MPENKNRLPAITENPEELVYHSCYAPFDLRDQLHSAETRSRIRRLPATQVFYSLKDLDAEEMALLLPHITEDQWTTFLDLDLWDKDEVNTNALLYWESFTTETEDPVARKLLRATDPELLQLLFRKELHLIPRTEEDEFEEEPPADRNTFITPDNYYLVVLPEDPEKSRLIYTFIRHLYHLDADYAQLCLENSRYETPIGLEEKAYQNRCRRTEDLGFQDYFEALEIYSPRSPESELPQRDNFKEKDPSELPVPASGSRDSKSILVEALAILSTQEEIEDFLQELFFVCNKVISADRLNPGEPQNIQTGIAKTISGINLGLDIWSKGDLGRAVEGIRRHFLVSLFQVGSGALDNVRQAALETVSQPPGSYGEAVLNGLREPYPLYTESEEKDGKITFSARHFRTAAEVREILELLETLRG